MLPHTPVRYSDTAAQKDMKDNRIRPRVILTSPSSCHFAGLAALQDVLSQESS
mgnify:CR=1 FL=1